MWIVWSNVVIAQGAHVIRIDLNNKRVFSSDSAMLKHIGVHYDAMHRHRGSVESWAITTDTAVQHIMEPVKDATEAP